MSDNRWILPDGVQETLPPDALAVELLRRRLLQTFDSWGYDMVMPPMIEYLDSLLTGTAHSLERLTFSLVDQISGKQMGVRSDMTPQVARIDAHMLADREQQNRITRLCYCGHLLHTRGPGLTSSRTPLQIGAEIFGSTSIDADIEVARLMLEMMDVVGLPDVSIDIGHVGVFRSLIELSGLDEIHENRLFDMLQRKSIPDLQAYLAELPLTDKLRDQICQLALMNGDVSILDEAKARFSGLSEKMDRSLATIRSVVDSLANSFPELQIHCDLSELRGYSYHTGLVFAAFLPGQGKEIARGGRYDDVGKVFGNARPATGFSADLLELYQLSSKQPLDRIAILAPQSQGFELQNKIASLRNEGFRVVIDLSAGELSAEAQSCQKILIRSSGAWGIEEV
ncbi:MAG: ATP phosphoribosyltransferase regulatory subunit [Gammaproteobacteria bacterium]|jgi:ATP phosphoribosyltransferase regulatory subunit